MPTVDYVPRGAALELFRRRDPEVIMAGPAGTGKSIACLNRLHYAALSVPGVRCLILRKWAVTLGATTLNTFEKKVAQVPLSRGEVSWYGGSQREPACYRYPRGSAIVVGGMDKPSKIMSSDYDLIFADELTELSITDWEAAKTRLRNGVLAWQQQLGACNPDHPGHWVKQRADAGGSVMLHSRHRDNPAYYRDDGTPTLAGAAYMEKLDGLTGVRRLRLRDGVWAAAEGLVFEDWDESVHLIEWFKPPENWTRWWVIDFGYVNPMVVQRWAEDGDGRLYLYREHYFTRKTVDEFALDVLADVADPDPSGRRGWRWREPTPRAVICDHDAEGREVFRRVTGLSTRPAKKGVTDGIQAVQKRLKPAGDGKPRIFIMRGALAARDPDLVNRKLPACTAEEIPGYVWAKPGLTAASQAPKEIPLKQDDHGCDDLRYLCAERERGTPGIRIMK